MRVGLISDLHIDINKDYPIVELTAETATEKSGRRIGDRRRYQ